MEQTEKEREWLVEYTLTFNGKSEEKWIVIEAPDIWTAFDLANAAIEMCTAFDLADYAATRKISLPVNFLKDVHIDIWSICETE